MSFERRPESDRVLPLVDVATQPAPRPAAGKTARTDHMMVQRRAATAPSASQAPVPSRAPSVTAAELNALMDAAFAPHLAIQADGGALTGDDIHATAAAGFAAPASPLPHLATIQRAFGDHDVQHVTAHVGGAARTAAAAIGADAYAMGHRVAFTAEPDLHTAAHEAAHVVQQRAGVQLHGGVGAAGDVYEQHADAVADLVVRGQSAAALLDAGPRGGAASAAVQRKGAKRPYMPAPAGPGTKPPAAPEAEPTPDPLSPTEELAAQADPLDEKWTEQRATAKAPEPGRQLDTGSKPAATLDGADLGDPGHTANLGTASYDRAEGAIAAGDYSTLAPPVAIVTEPFVAMFASHDEWLNAKGKDLALTTYNGSLLDWDVTADPVGVTDKKHRAMARTIGQRTMLERHRMHTWKWVESYNAWATIANTANTARADMIEAAQLLGYDLASPKDMVNFVESMEQGLSQATELTDEPLVPGRDGPVAWKDRLKTNLGPARPAVANAVPIRDRMSTLISEFDLLRVAQGGVFDNFIAVQKAAAQDALGAAEGKAADLTGLIDFWSEMTGTIDVLHGKASKVASGTIAGDLAAGGQDRAARRRADDHYDDAAKAAKRGDNAGANDALDERDTALATESTEAEKAKRGARGGAVDISVAGIARTLLTMKFEDQLAELAGKIGALRTKIKSKEAIQQLNLAETNLAAYKVALGRLKAAAKALEGDQLKDREDQYVEAGHQLDDYAYQHAATLRKRGKAHLATRMGEERMAPVMLMASKIRAYLSLINAARTAFPYDEFVPQALTIHRERMNPDTAPEVAAVTGARAWPSPAIQRPTKAERRMWDAIDHAYAAVVAYAEKASIMFGPLEQKVTELLQRMKGTKVRSNEQRENPY